MKYTQQEILNFCETAMEYPATFYQADVINYRGRTTDTDILYNELVAKFVVERLDHFIKGIPTITRQKSYKTESHTGKRIPSDLRKEENIAVELFNQKKFEHIGKIIDYQTPLKNVATDKAGKIDLLAYDGTTLYILELKKPDSTETMLRCVLEGYTYMKTADIKKLLTNFNLPTTTKEVACPLVFLGGAQHQEMQEHRPALRHLMNALNSKPYYITKEDGNYRIVEE